MNTKKKSIKTKAINGIFAYARRVKSTVMCKLGKHDFQEVDNTAFYNGYDLIAYYKCSHCGREEVLGDAERYRLHIKGPAHWTAINVKTGEHWEMPQR